MAARSEWSTLVEYLLSCVLRESLVAPVPLKDRGRWSVLPLPAETVLCGNDLTLPPLPELLRLFAGLEPLEGVFYGWPTVVVLDEERRVPFVAPLFVRRLDEPRPDGETVPVNEEPPRVNMGLLGMPWFPAEALRAAAATIAGGVVGFGQAAAVTSVASGLLTALGVPLAPLDPTGLLDLGRLGDPWRPQEVGVFNLAMAFKGTLDAATRNLIRDLEWMVRATDWRNSAARFLFEDAPVAPAALPGSSAVTLNDAQEIALATAATAPLTVITGPPGTGKSQTVTAIMADAWLRGESVLLSSTNNTPIDDVIDNKARTVDEALVLRTGNADKRQQLGARLRQLVAAASDRAADPAGPTLPETTHARHLTTHLLQQHAEVGQAVLEAARGRARARSWLWGSDQPPRLAVPPAALRPRAVRAERTWWGWLRRRRTRRLLDLAGITNPVATAGDVRAWVDAEAAVDRAGRNLTLFQRSTPPDLLEEHRRTGRRWRAASVAAVRNRIRDGVTSAGAAMLELADVLTRELSGREALARVMAQVKGWATSALSTRPNFDCRAGLIDLVVIDEASQCNLAQVLPLAYRARRLVIVGDPHQLSPVVTAHGEELRALAAAAGTTHEALVAAHHTYGEDSAFTAFAARFRPEPLLLDEHYRCHPEIIQFCNAQFYDNRLVVLTAVDRADDPARGLEWREVDGRTERGPTGSAVNAAEAAAVVDWLLESSLPPDRVGVVTPFRAQAAKIRQLVRRHGGAMLDGVRIGTAHTFQGGECDTILFSTVIAPGALPGTVSWLESERNLINVAVSRARRHLVVFGNRAELGRAKAATLLGLAAAATERAAHRDPTASDAVRSLHAALVAVGLPAGLGGVDEGYPLAITMTAPGGERIDIEVDEFPGGDPRGRIQRQSAIRDDNVRRLGWRVVRVPGWQVYLDPAAAVDRVRRALAQE
ncbi:MAG TPA: AAA domain-containing protein [Actinophytocola sp.]|nr:AAA domain-containing protein [Actinophytocola sp.]